MQPAKKLLVTGGAGFIGANFIRWVYAERPRWSIVNLDALTYAGNPGNLVDIADANDGRYQLVRGDICDVSLLDKLFNEFRFDAVVHFAAESHVDRSIVGPARVCRNQCRRHFSTS